MIRKELALGLDPRVAAGFPKRSYATEKYGYGEALR
jgi:hypothetical protein